jgi:2-hydroxy-6-oxonona-2,4-dienedioate hydrolase
MTDTATTITDEGTGKTVETSAGTVYYNEAGEGHPLLLLHGSGPGATGWSNFGRNMGMLSGSFRCIAPDMPGWGRSVAVTYEQRDHVASAIELLDALGIEKAAVVGNSMGGATAVKLAAQHPDRVSHLITMGVGYSGSRMFSAGDGPSEGLKLLQAAYIDPSPEGMRRMVDIFTFDKTFATDALVEQRSAVARSRPDHLENFIGGMAKPRRGVATAEEIVTITAPSLIMHGRDDRVVHYEGSLNLVSMIPNARMVLVNRCGHWLMLEHSDEFNRLVDDFVRNN